MYSENRRPWFFYLLGLILVATIIGAAALFYSMDFRGTSEIAVYWLAFCVPIASLFLMACSSSRYSIRYDGLHLAFGFLGWRVVLRNSEIISAEHADIKWIRWGGMGWRIRGLRTIGYILKSGPGIEIKTTRKGRSYTFNCDDPKALLGELATAGVAIGSDSAI